MLPIEANYTIKDLERLSGIKAHTIRIWEQRYNLFKPDRTTTNEL
jgi:DNA-binding transcriptional MerR regulator